MRVETLKNQERWYSVIHRLRKRVTCRRGFGEMSLLIVVHFSYLVFIFSNICLHNVPGYCTHNRINCNNFGREGITSVDSKLDSHKFKFSSGTDFLCLGTSW